MAGGKTYSQLSAESIAQPGNTALATGRRAKGAGRVAQPGAHEAITPAATA